jgi:hypothetical protein
VCSRFRPACWGLGAGRQLFEQKKIKVDSEDALTDKTDIIVDTSIFDDLDLDDLDLPDDLDGGDAVDAPS